MGDGAPGLPESTKHTNKRQGCVAKPPLLLLHAPEMKLAAGQH
eukprot:gene2705-13511_t